ncbi:flagellar motor switch protein FliN, partial [Myxococcota bacterium]|nr:flagellar motor switch protein FliN [Myxococcota bacterium]
MWPVTSALRSSPRWRRRSPPRSCVKSLEAQGRIGMAQQARNIEFLFDVELEVAVVLGRTRMLIQDLLELTPGSVVELNKLAGEALDIVVNDKVIARGEAVVVNEKFGVRLTEIVSPLERV